MRARWSSGAAIKTWLSKYRTTQVVVGEVPWHLYWLARHLVRRVRGPALQYAPSIEPTDTTRAAIAARDLGAG